MARALLLGAAAALILSVGVVAHLPSIQLNTASYLLAWTTAAGAFAILVYASRSPPWRSQWLFRWPGIVGLALLLRMAPLFAEPYLSDDVYRYLWEGQVQRAGYSPYVHPPNDPQLAFLRDSTYSKVNHPEISAVYPPLIQEFFRFTPGGLAGWKILVLVADLGILGLVLWLLRSQGRPAASAVFYAAHPLVVIELTASAHLDGIALCFLMGAVASICILRKPWLTGLLTAGSFLCKPPGLVALVVLLRRRHVGAVLLCGGLILAGCLPFAGDDALLFRGFGQYSQHWEFNGLLFPTVRGILQTTKNALEDLAGESFLFQWLRECGYSIQPSLHARRFGLALFLLLAAVLSWKLGRRALLACPAVLLAFLATHSTVYPWYVLWLVPFLPFFPSNSLLLLTLTTGVTGVIKVQSLTMGIWQEEYWVRLLHWLPPCLLGAWELWRSQRFTPLPPKDGSTDFS